MCLDSFEKSVMKTAEKYNMISPGDRIVAGLSGGADSSVMLCVLKALSAVLNFEVCAAHLNHGIRGGEAERDRLFSERLAKSLNIPFFTETVSVPEYAQKKHISEETAGRELRYEYFRRLCAEHRLTKIAVAHNLNDRAESVILNLIRGCGVNGLCGIKAVNGNIIRPLIDTSRKQIESYAAENGIKFVTDSSNLSDIYSRNIVRNNVFGELERINDNTVGNIARCSGIISDENDFMEGYVTSLSAVTADGENIRIDRRIFDAQHIAVKRRIVFEAVRKLKGNTMNLPLACVDSISNAGRTGSTLQIPGGITAAVEHCFIVLSQGGSQQCEYEYNANSKSIIDIAETGIKLEFSVKKAPISPNSGIMCLNFDKLYGKRLTVRSRKDGDAFFPSGMNGGKRIKKFFIDNKIPLSERNNYPILTADGEIAAVIPLRVDRNYIIDKTTENILMIKITGGHNG